MLTPWFLFRRLVKGKRSAPWRAKFGHLAERPAQARVWIHAVSVGEAAAAESLVKAIRAAYPAMDVVVSTTTTTGQELAIKKYGAENVFYYPHDLSWVVRRVLDRVKPSIIVLMELEVWPNLTAEAKARGIPLVVVNGRITARSARRYKRFWWLVGPSFKRVNRWLVQTREYADRLIDLGVDTAKIEISGNIKYDAIDLKLPTPSERAELRANFGIDPAAIVLAGGSTHPTEEQALLDCYAALRKTIPNLRLVLVPRHPERATDVENQIRAAGFACVRRSALRDRGIKATLGGINDKERARSVLLIDTVGELTNVYKMSDAAFIGGSLIPHGGQNIMEPCGLGVPVVHGRHMHNFNEAMEILRGCNGSVEVTRESLFGELQKLLNEPDAAKAMAARARDAFLKEQGATQRALKCIDDHLKAACVRI